MSDEQAPSTEKEGDFTFEIDKGGNLLIDGVVTDRVINPLQMTPPEGEQEEEPIEEVAPESAEEEPKAEEKPPEPPLQPADTRETIGKQKFKLKVYGEELEKEFDHNELVATLQKGLAADKRFQEIAAKEREIEPFQHIVKSDKFKGWLDEQIAAGEIEAPAPPPKPEPEDIMGYRLRATEPEFESIRSAMSEWAVTLPQYEAEQLQNNHRVFNMAYDRFKAAKAQNAPAPPEKKIVATKEVAEVVIAAKEQRKETARAERTGLQPGEHDANKARQQKLAQLQRRSRQGDLNASVELARMLFAEELNGQI